MNQDRNIHDLLKRARRVEPSDAALDRVWRRIKAPPPTDPGGDDAIDPTNFPDLEPAVTATLGKTMALGAIKAVVAAAAIGGFIAIAARATAPSGEPPDRVEHTPSVTPAPAPEEPARPAPELLPAPPPVTEPAGPPRRKPAAAAPVTDLAAERELLARAQAAHQRKDLADAQAALDEHAREFPRGVLAGERELLRVLTLCAAGEADRAASIARALIARGDAGLFLPRLQASCVGERLAPVERAGDGR